MPPGLLTKPFPTTVTTPQTRLKASACLGTLPALLNARPESRRKSHPCLPVDRKRVQACKRRQNQPTPLLPKDAANAVEVGHNQSGPVYNRHPGSPLRPGMKHIIPPSFGRGLSSMAADAGQIIEPAAPAVPARSALSRACSALSHEGEPFCPKKLCR